MGEPRCLQRQASLKPNFKQGCVLLPRKREVKVKITIWKTRMSATCQHRSAPSVAEELRGDLGQWVHLLQVELL